MRNLMLKLEYDGTHYHGWQKQDNALSIQEVLEDALAKITKQPVNVIGCSRTDAGVHALGYICNFHTEGSIPAQRMTYALNSILPKDIVALDCNEVDGDFHARFCAKGKKYRYRIINRVFHSAFERDYSFHWPYKLDIPLMQESTELFIGTHDFKAFMASGSAVKNTVRTIYELEISHKDGEIIIEVSGDGFLYNMVRIIAGTMLYIGNGRIDPRNIPEIIEKGNRKKAGITAPAQGLYLVEVYY